MSPVYFLFFVSGFSALIYELLWFRHLGFIFGNTVYAATTVVTAYMTGLGFGAWFFGRRAESMRNPVRVFGLLETGIGGYALVMPFLFHAVRLAYRFAYQHGFESLAVLTSLRFIMAFGVMLVPTILMGGTLPVLSRALLRRFDDFGKKLGLLYGLNTLGAVAGVLAAGFVLLPALGLRVSGWVAVACNLVVGVMAWRLGKTPADEPAGESAMEPDDNRAVPEHAGVVPWVMMLSGFVALALEVVWFRALILVFGSTTYSFTAMLACYLVGIGLGSIALGSVADRVCDRLGLLGAIQLGIGAFTLASIYWYPLQPQFLLEFLVSHGLRWSTMVSAQFIIALGFLLAPTVLMGFAFPVATALVRPSRRTASGAVGELYAFNTAGCIAGSLAGGFLLLPGLGIQHSIELLAVVSLFLALVLVLLSEKRSLRSKGAFALAFLVAAIAIRPPTWNPKLLSAGPHFSPWLYIRDGKVILHDKLAQEDLLYYKEGLTATVSVNRDVDGTLSYCSSGKVEADTSARSMMLQRIAGHLPMLFHPNAQSVLNIGLGAGVSLGALASHGPAHLEVVEIEHHAVDVAEVFSAYNHDVVHAPRLTISIDDGRNHLFCTTNRYDVITSDPFEPVHAGANHLYTVDHFRQARKCLTAGGIMSQYVPLYELAQNDYLAIIRSFVQIFPDSALFYTGEDTVLLGFNGPVDLNPTRLLQKFRDPAVKESLGSLGFTEPETLLGMFVADLRHTDLVGDEGDINSDDHPVVEFSAPKSALRYTTFDNSGLLLAHFTDFPETFLSGLDESSRAKVIAAREGLRLTLEAGARRAAGDVAGALTVLQSALAKSPQHPVIRNELVTTANWLAEDFMKGGDLEQAESAFEYILQASPNDFWSLYNLVFISMQKGNAGAAGDYLRRALAAYPASGTMLALNGKYLATTGHLPLALDAYREAVARSPSNVEIWRQYAEAGRAGERLDIARDADARVAQLLRDQNF